MPDDINMTVETIDTPPMERINISVSNLIAKNTNHSAIVRYNSGYRAVFDFDTNTGIENLTWADLSKSAKFIYNSPSGESEVKVVPLSIDETTNECYANVPIVDNGAECMLIGVIGTYGSGGNEMEIYTTTSAFVMCIESIQDLDGGLAPTEGNVNTITIDNTANAGLGITNNGYLIFQCNQTVPSDEGEGGESFDKYVMTNGEAIRYSAGKILPVKAEAQIDEMTNDTLLNIYYDLGLDQMQVEPVTGEYIVDTMRLYFAYSRSADGSVDFSKQYDDSKTYLGIVASTETSDESFIYSDYSWYRIRANDGVRTIEIGTTTTGNPGTNASVSIDSTDPASPVLSFTIPRGDVGETGAQGPAATITVGSVTTGEPGTSASVTNSGTSGAAILNFTIPKGEKGDTGAQGETGATGATGSPGAAATITIGSVVTGSPNDPASVTNSGTSSAAIFDFVIPKGEKGDTGGGGGGGVMPSVTNSVLIFS